MTRLASWLRRLADWLDPLPALDSPAVESARDPVRELAGVLVARAERECEAGTSGEYKRHVVYAALIKAFPLVKKLDLSKAIDAAVGAL